MGKLTAEQVRVLKLMLRTRAVQNLMGAEEWDLTEDQESTLWEIIEGWASEPTEE